MATRICSLCESEPATVRCINCNLLFCEEDKKGHLRPPANKSHQFDTNVSSLEIKMSEKEVGLLEGKLKDTLNKILELQGGLEERQGESDSSVRKSVGDTFTQLRDALSQRESHFLKQLDEIRDRKKEILSSYETSINSFNTQLQTLLEQLQEAAKTKNETKILDIESQTQQIIAEMEEKKLFALPKKEPKWRFLVDHLTAIQTTLSSLGTLVEELASASHSTASGDGITFAKIAEPASFIVTANDSSGKQRPHGGDHISVSISDYKIDQITVEDQKDGTYKVTYTLPREANGRVKLEVSLNGTSISGSPFDVEAKKPGIEGKFLFYSYGHSTGQIKNPRGIAVTKDFVFISSWELHCIQVFDTKEQFVRQFGSYGSEDGQFNNPCGLAIDSAGRLYVADYYNSRVQVFDSEGKFIRKWAVGSNVSSLSISGNEIYITEINNHRIVSYTLEGELIRRIGNYGDAGGQFSSPNCITISDNLLYIADTRNHRVQVLTKEGKFLLKWGSQGDSDEQFYSPQTILCDSDFVYVADDNNSIKVFTKDGKFVKKWGTRGSAEGEFQNIRALALHPDGILYTVEEGNHRVQKFI